MIQLLQSPLAPVIFLLVAGALLRVVVPVRRASTLALVTLLPLAITFVWALRLRLGGDASLTTTWQPLVVQPLPTRWLLDGWNWLAASLLLLVGACAVLLTWRLPGQRTGPYHGLSLLLVGGAVLSVISDSLLVLSYVWVAGDILLIARARGSRQAERAAPAGLLAASSLLVMVALGITGQSVATTSLTVARLPVETIGLLLVASALRMAAYPFHLWLGPGDLMRDQGTRWLVGGVALVTGGWLLGRLFSLGAVYWLSQPLWGPVLATAIIAAGLAAWAGSKRDRLIFFIASRAAWLWLAVALAPAALGRDALGWALATLVVGSCLFVVGEATVAAWRWPVPLILAAAVLAGLPLTAGLAAVALTPAPNPLLWLLFGVGQGLALSCVFVAWRSGTQSALGFGAGSAAPASIPLSQRWPAVRLLLAFGLAAVPALLWGVRPDGLARLAGFSTAPTLGRLIATMPVSQWFAVIFSLGAGWTLAWALVQPGLEDDGDWQRRRQRLARVVSLGWTMDVQGPAVAWLDSAWRAVVTVVEGAGYLGWLAILLLLAVLIVQG